MTRTPSPSWWRAAGAVVLFAGASGVLGDTPMLAPVAGATADAPPPAPWAVVLLPNQSKPQSRFASAIVDGRAVLRISADNSYATLVHPLPHGAPQGHSLAWRWRVDQPLPKADLRDKSGDDTAVKVCALFDEPLDKVPLGERMWLKAASTLAGADTPAATVCYVWDAHLPAGTVLPSPFTRRVRYLVLHSEDVPLATWVSERRNLDADFLQLFGDEVKAVPPLVAVMLGADADNTHGRSVAYVGDLVLER